ncbi:MAG TPA: cohesin domain-containing protein, partial [Thermoanaerobaculia bacterium]|nr:cohesin domain-containing protein [Thermoanaerobaculia bacterium]
GDRVPIPLTTFNTQNAGNAGGIIPITSFQYQDVGIKIELEPRVHHNQEVTLKMKIEVSNLNGNVAGSNGESQPIIGTRMIDSVIRLKDGETNFLAGLLRTDESSIDRGIPGLSDIPLLGRLFSNKRHEGARTDVILTMTPHIVRNAEITEEDLLPIWVGTEQNITFRGGSPRVESDVEGPFDNGEGTPEEIQDAIRRRLQRLPRGLRPGENGEPTVEAPGAPGQQQPQQQPPGGVNLVPVAPPSNIFQPPTPAPPPPEEQPPSGSGGTGLVSGGTASGTASLAVRAASLTGTEKAAAVTAASSTAAAVRLWLSPAKLTVSPGDTFEVRVQAEAGQPVSHLPLSLLFDPKVLAVEKVEAGDFLGGSGEARVMSDSSRPGDVVIGASRLGKVPGVKGTGTVARVTFRALAAGSSELGLDGKALDASLRALAVRSRPARVEVTGSSPRPEPSPSPKREASAAGRR